MSQYSKNGQFNNNRVVHNKYNQQQQTQIQKEQEKVQSEIQYYIYQDLQNIINLIQSRKAVFEYFKNDPNHGMITQSNNKLILQLNLSSAIHFDQQQQYQKQPEMLSFLKEERNKAYKILEKLFDNNDQSFNANQNNDDVILNYLQQYKQKYQKQELTWNDQFPLIEIKQVARFDEGMLQKCFSLMQKVDSQLYQISEDKSYKVPDQNEIQQKANDYYNKTQVELQNNFPIQNPQDNQMKNQDILQQNQNRIINISGQCNVNQGSQINKKALQPGCDEQKKLNNQQDKRISEKEKLIDFINCLRYQNLIPSEKQPFHIKNNFAQITFLDKVELNKKEIKWAIDFQKQDLLQQLINLHDYFYLFMEYQKQIKGPDTTQFRQIDMEKVKTLISNDLKQKKEGKTYIFNIIGFMYFCKDQIEISSSNNQNQQTTDPYNSPDPKQTQQANQEYDEDQISKFYQSFCSFYQIK